MQMGKHALHIVLRNISEIVDFHQTQMGTFKIHIPNGQEMLMVETKNPHCCKFNGADMKTCVNVTSKVFALACAWL